MTKINYYLNNYNFIKDGDCVYTGEECSHLVQNLSPYTEHMFHYQLFTPENGELSSPSEPIRVQTLESTPTAPLNLKVIVATTTQIKLSWEPPETPNGNLRAYFVYNGDEMLDQTSDLQYIVAGLQPLTSIEFGVCASTSVGKGEMATIRCGTCSLGDVTPEKPVFGLVGTREILVRWQPPQVITGKLNRYELCMNGKCIYSGIALDFQVTMLRPDTEYKFEVMFVTFKTSPGS